MRTPEGFPLEAKGNLMKCDPFEHAETMLHKAIKVKVDKPAMPYPGQKYNFVRDGYDIFVEGWHGTLIINKLLVYKTMYGFIDPIILPDTSFYGRMSLGNRKNYVNCIYTNAKIMFHGVFDQRNIGVQTTCWGDQNYYSDWTLELLRKNCLEAASALSIVKVDTIHIDVMCPWDSKYKEVSDWLLEGYREITPDTPGFDKYFVPLL